MELVLAPSHVGAAEPPVDPSPLDMGEVVHHADKRDEPSFGSPAGLGVIDALEIAQHSPSQVPQPVEQQFLFILAPLRKGDVVFSPPVTLGLGLSLTVTASQPGDLSQPRHASPLAGPSVAALEERGPEPAPVDAVASDAWPGQLHDFDQVDLLEVRALAGVLPDQGAPVEHVPACPVPPD